MEFKITRIEDLRFHDYMNEITRYEQVLRKRPDFACKKRIQDEINEQRQMLEKYSLDADECEDIDALWDSFEEFESEKIDEYYNEMTSYFKTLYAIFENQTARETRRLDFDRYPKIKEMNWAVNVMKHCKGNSYQNLVDSGSKFVQPPVEFPGILERTTASEVLNLEYQDMIDFCQAVRTAWNDRLNEEQAEFRRAHSTETEEESAK